MNTGQWAFVFDPVWHGRTNLDRYCDLNQNWFQIGFEYGITETDSSSGIQALSDKKNFRTNGEFDKVESRSKLDRNWFVSSRK